MKGDERKRKEKEVKETGKGSQKLHATCFPSLSHISNLPPLLLPLSLSTNINKEYCDSATIHHQRDTLQTNSPNWHPNPINSPAQTSSAFRQIPDSLPLVICFSFLIFFYYWRPLLICFLFLIYFHYWKKGRRSGIQIPAMPPRGKKKKASKKKRKKDLAVHPHSPTHSQTDSSAYSPSHSQDGNGGNDENDAIAVSRNGAGREDCEDKGENPELDNGDKVANGPENGDGNRKGKRTMEVEAGVMNGDLSAGYGSSSSSLDGKSRPVGNGDKAANGSENGDGNRKGKRKMEDEAGVMNGDSYAGYGSSGSSSDGESRPIGNKSESELGKLALSVDPAKEVVPLTENVPQTREAASIEDSHVLEANIMNMVPLPHGTHRDGSESHKGSVAHNSLEDKVNGESQPVDSQLERELEKLAAFVDPIKEVISSAQEAPRPKEAPLVDDSQVLDADNFQPDENKKEMSPFSSENPIDGGCDWHTESGHKVNGAQPVENQSGKELKKSVPSVDSFKQVVSTMEVAPQAKEVSLGDDSQDLHVRNFGPEEDENKITPFPHENPSEGCECHKESGDQYMPEDKVSIEEITQDKEAALVDDSQVLDPGDLLSKENSKMASLPRENPGDGCESQKESGCSDCPENKVNLPLAPVQRSSWKNCCGLLEVLMGSKN